MRYISATIFIVIGLSVSLLADSGKRAFETYCWGCHYQTATAFGPSFAQNNFPKNSRADKSDDNRPQICLQSVGI